MAGRLWILSALLFFGLQAFAASTSPFTYHGRIVLPAGTPEQDTNVQFKLQIYSPGSEHCLMYEETQTLNMAGTSGAFSLTLNGATSTRTDGGGYTVEQILANLGTMTFASCTVGSTYAPGSFDDRLFIVQFSDSTMAGVFDSFPSQALTYVPKAIDAEQVAGYPAASLLRFDNSGVPFATTSFNSTQYTNLEALANGTSNQYVQSGTAGATIPTYSGGGTPTGAVAGDIWYNGSGLLAYYTGTSVETLGPSGAGISSLTVTNNLTAGGTAAGTLTGPGTIDLNTTGVTAGTYTKVTVDTFGRVTTGAQITGSDITSGTIGGSTAISTTGSIVTTGSVTAKIDYLYDHGGAGPDYVGFQSPTSVTNYVLTWPAAVATGSGQVLTSDTSGNLSWTTPASSLPPSGPAAGDLSGTYPNPTVANVDGVAYPAAPTTNTVPVVTGSNTVTYEAVPVTAGGTGLTATTNSAVLTTDGSGTPQWTTISSDTFAQYALLAGRSGGQVLNGGTAASDDLTLNATSGASPTGSVLLQTNGGNVGIGTTNPAAMLEVNGSFAAMGAAEFFNQIGTPYASSSATAYAPGGGNYSIALESNVVQDSDLTLEQISVRNAAANTQNAYIGAVSNTGAGVYTPTIVIGQQTGANAYSERMRIDQNGNVGIGTTTPAGNLAVDNTAHNANICLNGTCVNSLGTGTATGVSAGNGTAGAPSISFSSDTNTGFYDAGSHTIGVSSNGTQVMGISTSGVSVTVPLTFGSAGQMTISSTGQVTTTNNLQAAGLAATGSENDLYATSSAAIPWPYQGGSDDPVVTISNSSPLDTTGAFDLYMARNTAGNTQRAYMGIVSNTGAGAYTPTLVFGQQTGATAYNERMRLDSSGNLAVGTTAPAATLHVSKPSSGTIGSASTTVTGTGTTFTTSFNVGDTIIAYGQSETIASIASDTSLTTTAAFSPAITAGAPYMRGNGVILNSGGVGIGTATPGAALSVWWNGMANGGFSIGSGDGNTVVANQLINWMNYEDSTVYTPTSATLPIPATSTLRINNTASTVGNMTGFTLGAKGANANAYMMALTPTSGNSPPIVIGQQTGAASYAERMRIDQNGNVGIGSTAPVSSLDLSQKTDAVALPAGTTAQEPSGGNLVAGQIRYNTNSGTPPGWIEFYNGSAWQQLGGGSGSQSFAGDVTLNGASNGLTVTNNSIFDGNVTQSGAGTLSTGTGNVSLNGATTIAANQNLTMTSGTGQFSETYSGTGPAAAITDTAGASGNILNLTTTSTAANNNDAALDISVSGANGAASVTRYGVESSVTATGATSTNVAGYFSATGATNNYGLIVPNGYVGIGTTTPSFSLSVGDGTASDGAILAQGYGTVGTNGETLGVSGAGTRMIWYPKKAAFRAGNVTGNDWNDANIGNYSIALGQDVEAGGVNSVALGGAINASGAGAFGAGYNVTASGNYSVGLGSGTASGSGSVVLGIQLESTGQHAQAFGTNVNVGDGTAGDGKGDYSMAFGAGNSTGTYPEVTGVNSIGFFMGNQSGATVSANNVMAILGGSVGIGSTIPTSALDLNGALTIEGMAVPAVSPAGDARIYFDSTSHTLQISQNNGAYTQLATNGGSQTFSGNDTFSGTVDVTNATASTSPTTGALQVTGGVGVGGNINSAGNMNVASGQAFEINGANALSEPSTDSTAGGSIAVGTSALAHEGSLAPTAFDNTAIGYQAMSSASMTTAAIQNTAVGFESLQLNTSGQDNTALGYLALNQNTSGNYNVAIGDNTLYDNQTGIANVAIGHSALTAANVSDNTAVGSSALHSATGGSNTAVGDQAGYDVTSGSDNIFIGIYAANGTNVTSGANNIMIGQDVRPPSQTANNQLNIGNLIYATGLSSGATLSTGSVGIGTTVPGNSLDVRSASGFQINFMNSGATGSNYGQIGADVNGFVRFNGAGGVAFDSASTEIARFANTGFYLGNYANTATSSNNYSSPVLQVTGEYWNGSASTGDVYQIQNVIGTGANPGTTMEFTHNGTSGSSSYSFMGSSVGIGTTSPGGTLDVEGGTAGFLVSGANIVLVAQNGGPGPANTNGGNIILTPGAKTGGGTPGGVGIGTTTPVSSLDLSQKTDAIALPSGTTAQEPTGGNLVAGEIRYNNSTSAVEFYNGAAWITLDTTNGGQTFSGDITLSGAGNGLTVSNNSVFDGNVTQSGSGTLSTGTGTVSLNGNTTVAANENLSMASGTGTFTQTYTGIATPFSITANSQASGSLISLSSNSTVVQSTGAQYGLNISLSGANAQTPVTRTGIYSNVTSTGTASTNIAASFSASGGTNNYGLLVTGGNVGIGSSTPTSLLTVAGTIQSTSGGVKFPDGTTQATSVTAAANAPTQTIYTSGSGTFTTPAGALWLRVRMVGGGAGGGGSGATSGNGTVGGSSTFGTYTAEGGSGGPNSSTGGFSGGVGGAGSGCDLNGSGSAGQSVPGNTSPAVLGAYGGSGGASAMGGGGSGGGNGSGATGGAGLVYGGGGGGVGANNSYYSSAGGGGGGYCEKMITSPGASYAYAVGGGGAGGTSGTGGGTGGAGAAGVIIIEVHYVF